MVGQSANFHIPSQKGIIGNCTPSPHLHNLFADKDILYKNNNILKICSSGIIHNFVNDIDKPSNIMNSLNKLSKLFTCNIFVDYNILLGDMFSQT